MLSRTSHVTLLLLWWTLGRQVSADPANNLAGVTFLDADVAEEQIWSNPSFTEADGDPKDIMQQMRTQYTNFIQAQVKGGGACTEDKMIVRKEWGDLSSDERKDYIRACKCLHNAPSKTPPQLAPGARSRWDDFVVAHIINSDNVHRSPWLLKFHRHFLHLLERALRDECGYKGGLPYWEHSRYIGQPIEKWPLFDGSDTSISGNGKEVKPGCHCITDGPLKDWVCDLACTPNPRDDGLGYNPRCIERVFQPRYLENMTYEHVAFTISNFKTIDDFASRVETWPTGIHALPHVFIGGSQDDSPSSASDPVFVAHHVGLDLYWTIWQSLDWNTRGHALAKPESYTRIRAGVKWPAAPPISLDDHIYLSPVFENVTVKSVMSTIGGQYCYRYE